MVEKKEKKKYDDFSDNDETTEAFHKEIIIMMQQKIVAFRAEIEYMELKPYIYARMIPVIKRQITRFQKEIALKEAELKEYESRGFVDNVD